MSSFAEFRGGGGRIVLAATVGLALGSSPVPFYEIGLFAPELAREFHWSLGQIMNGTLFMMLGILVMGPAVGVLVDRYGTRRVVLNSIVLFSAMLGLFCLQNGSLPFYYATWLLVAVLGAGTLPIPWTRAVNGAFEVRKGLALGVTLAGSGLSSLCLKPLMARILATHGWRVAFAVLALLPLLIALPLAWLYFKPVERGGASSPAPSEGVTLHEAITEWRFWLVGLAVLMMAFGVAGPIPNLEGILRSQGLPPDVVMEIVPLVGLAVILGRVAGGWLLDRLWAPAVAAGLCGVSSVAMWLMVHGSSSIPTATCGVLGVGIIAGTEFDIIAFMTARYFGSREYGGIYGSLSCFFALGAGTAPTVYGRMFDATRSFMDIVSVGALLIVAGAALFLMLGPYRFVGAR